MASKQPIIRQISLFAMAVQIVIMYLLIIIYNFIRIGNPLIVAMITYLGLQMILGYAVTKNHRRGVVLHRSGKYKDAIKEFEKSYDYFKNHRWIDRFRAVVLMSSSKASFMEMALVNMAYCLREIGAKTKSKAMLDRALQEFPNSRMAKSAYKED